MASSQGGVILSSNTMNDQLQMKDYKSFFDLVEGHFLQRPDDHTSAGKLATAVAYHLYHNPCKDASLAERLMASISIALSAISIAAAVSPPLFSANETTKAMTAVTNILSKGFLRDAWLGEARATVQAARPFFECSVPAKDRMAIEFLCLLEEIIGEVEDVLQRHKGGELEEDVRQLLRDSKLAVPQTEMKVLYLLLLKLDIYFLELGSALVPDKVPLLNKVESVVEEALALCQKIRNKKKKTRGKKNAESAAICEEKVFAMCCRFSSEFRAKHSDVTERLLESCLKATSAMSSAKVLSLHHYLFEVSYDADEWEAADRRLNLLEEAVARIPSSSSSAASGMRFTIAVYQAFVRFSRWRLSHEVMQREVQVQLEAIAKLEAAAAAAADESAAMRDAGEAQNAKQVGDTNPYLSCLTLDAEEELQGLAKAAVASLQYAAGKKHKELSHVSSYSYLKPSCPLKMLVSLAEFFRMLGLRDQYREGILLLLRFARDLGYDGYEKLALSILVRHRWHSIKKQELAARLAPNLQDSFHHQVLLPASYAWHFLSVLGRPDKAAALATTVLRCQSSNPRQSAPARAISADMKHLLALCRCSPNSFVNYPSTPGLDRWDKDVEENGPIEHMCEAFKDAVSASHSLVNSQQNKNLLWFSEKLRAINTHAEVLEARTDLYMMVGLPKELILYGKLSLKLSQTLALPTRTCQNLLIMADINLLCDDAEQALGKLHSVRLILGSSLLGGSIIGGKSDASSSALHRSEFAVPGFFQHPQDCCCYCCSHSLLPLVVMRYFNLLGVSYATCDKADTAAAASYFEGARLLAHTHLARVEGKVNGEEEKDAAYLETFKILQWQVECYCRMLCYGEYRARVKELLREQRKVLAKIPNLLRCFPNLRARYFHQSQFLGAEDGEGNDDATTVEKELEGLALSTSLLLPPNSKENVSPSKFRTPPAKRPKPMPNLPRKPTKRLLLEPQ